MNPYDMVHAVPNVHQTLLEFINVVHNVHPTSSALYEEYLM